MRIVERTRLTFPPPPSSSLLRRRGRRREGERLGRISQPRKKVIVSGKSESSGECRVRETTGGCECFYFIHSQCNCRLSTSTPSVPSSARPVGGRRGRLILARQAMMGLSRLDSHPSHRCDCNEAQLTDFSGDIIADRMADLPVSA